VPNVTAITASVDSGGTLFVTWSDSRNLGANCNPLGDAATATPPCDNDVFYAYSTDGGATWSPNVQLTPAGSAQWQSWSAVVADGSKLWVAYYDRSYGDCESRLQ
jgi:Neuraminidase (sialidase)